MSEEFTDKKLVVVAKAFFLDRCEESPWTTWEDAYREIHGNVSSAFVDTCYDLNKNNDQILHGFDYVDGQVHVMPSDGPIHFENKYCWCHPRLDFEDKNKVWVHQDTRPDALN